MLNVSADGLVKTLADENGNIIQTTLAQNGAILLSTVLEVGKPVANARSMMYRNGKDLLSPLTHGLTGGGLPLSSITSLAGGLPGVNELTNLAGELPIVSDAFGESGSIITTIGEPIGDVTGILGVTLPPMKLPSLGPQGEDDLQIPFFEHPMDVVSKTINLGNVLLGKVTQEGKIVIGSITNEGNIIPLDRLTKRAISQPLAVLSSTIDEFGGLHIRIKDPQTGDKLNIPNLDIGKLSIGLDINGRISGILSKTLPVLGSKCA